MAAQQGEPVLHHTPAKQQELWTHCCQTQLPQLFAEEELQGRLAPVGMGSRQLPKAFQTADALLLLHLHEMISSCNSIPGLVRLGNLQASVEFTSTQMATIDTPSPSQDERCLLALQTLSKHMNHP